MNTYKISSNDGLLSWTCKAMTEEEAWTAVSSVKNLSVDSVKLLFKIKQDDVRTNNDDRLVND